MGITIKDVAAAAGTSVSTVSKVINGHYSISEETAARVRRVMQELNYYPNASAQSFARGTTKTIAVLANLAPNTAFQNPHMFEIIAGLEESLSTRGYRLQLRGVRGFSGVFEQQTVSASASRSRPGNCIRSSQGSDLSAKCRRTSHPRFRNSISLVRIAYKIALSSHRVGRAEF